MGLIILIDENPDYGYENWQCSQIGDPAHDKTGKDWTEFKEICLVQAKLDQLNEKYEELLENKEL